MWTFLSAVNALECLKVARRLPLQKWKPHMNMMLAFMPIRSIDIMRLHKWMLHRMVLVLAL
jgi:hypothetical protein